MDDGPRPVQNVERAQKPHKSLPPSIHLSPSRSRHSGTLFSFRRLPSRRASAGDELGLATPRPPRVPVTMGADSDEDDLVVYGTPIEREEDTSARKRRAVAEAGQLRALPAWKQEVFLPPSLPRYPYRSAAVGKGFVVRCVVGSDGFELR